MKVFIKRLLFGVLIFCFLAPFSGGQAVKRKRYEAVLGLGPTQFFGDIGGFSKGSNIGGLRDFSISQTRFDLNLSLKYRISQRINARISLTYGFLDATDKRGSNEDRRFQASISIFEPAFIGEFYFIRNMSENNFMFAEGTRTLFGIFEALDFYTFAGFGGLNYSVRGNEKLVSAGINSGGFTTVIPVGLGSTLVFSPDFDFGVEIGGRYTFSDNLDGYAPEYSSSNDFYGFLNFTITYKFKTAANGLPSFK
jgi:hypothetical protein